METEGASSKAGASDGPSEDGASLQRVQNVSSNADVVLRLVDAKFTSATQIALMPLSTFIQAASQAGISPETAALCHQNAVDIKSRNELYLAAVAPSMSTEVPHVAPAMLTSAPVATVPSATRAGPATSATISAIASTAAAANSVNLDTLFGSGVSAECDNCNSVISPAAYFVDLLDFLPPAAKSVLDTRRPDIANLALSCANTNIELPYIDLVNEALGSYIETLASGQKPQVQTFNNEEGIDSQDLIAEPQSAIPKASQYLSKQVTPVGILPFDRDLEQSRILFEKLGTSRAEVLRTLGGDSPAVSRARTAETLGLPEAEYIALTKEAFTPRPEGMSSADYAKSIGLKTTAEYWGYADKTALLNEQTGICRIKRQFLPRTGYSYDDLVKLLKTKFVNGDSPQKLIKASKRLDELWRMVNWGEGYAKAWTDLLKYLDVAPESSLASDIINSFPSLPNTAVITMLGTSTAWYGGGLGRFSIAGYVYYGAANTELLDDAYIGFLDVRGMIQLQNGQYWFFDHEDLILRTYSPGNPGNRGSIVYSIWDYRQDQNKYFWIKAQSKTGPVVAKVERKEWYNGDITIISPPDAALQVMGPWTASPVAGWIWDPWTKDGEPKPDYMTLRTLSGMPLTEEWWERLHGFIRLQRRLGWSIEETDLILSAWKADLGKPAVLDKVAVVKTLQGLTGLPVNKAVVLLSATMDIGLYKSLFVKSSILKRDPSFGLSEESLPLFTRATAPRIRDRVTEIAVAFGVSPTDITAVLLSITNKLSEPAQVGLTTLSLLYRYILLCRAVGQPPTQLSSLLSVYETDPFLEPAETIQFIEFWQGTLSRYKVQPSQLEYIVTGRDVSDRLKPQAALVLQTSHAIKSARLEASTKQNAGEDEMATSIAQGNFHTRVASIFSEAFPAIPVDILTLLLGKADFAGSENANESQSYFVPPATGEYVILPGPKPTKPSTNPNPITGDGPIASGKPLNLVGGQFYLVDGPTFSAKFRGSDVQDLASYLLDIDTVRQTSDYLSLFTRYGILFSTIDAAGIDMETLLIIYKLPKSSDTFHRADLENLVAYDNLRSAVPGLKPLAALTSKIFSSELDVTRAIVDATGWDSTIIADLAPRFLDGPMGGTFSVNIQVLNKINKAYDLTRRLGVSDVDTISEWTDPAASSANIVTRLRNLVRGMIDEEAWNSTAAALFDPLRRRTRDALVAAALNVLPGLRDADDLFGYFLIDVSMGSCLKTSRIKQAISSIQILIQRCLLGLELPSISADTFDPRNLPDWEWKKSYDTWAANRKIWLYPENWLEPSLRDNKSEAFKAVERTLDQGKLAIEDAVAGLLAGYVETSNLEPISVYQGSSGQRDHIVARTRMAPHKFFYRSFDYATLSWSPWESMNVDIPTIQITRTLHRPIKVMEASAVDEYKFEAMTKMTKTADRVNELLRRFPNSSYASGSYVYPLTISGNDDNLVVFFPTFTERSFRAKDSNTDASKMSFYWEVGMTFSEREHGQWAPRKVAPETLDTRDQFDSEKVASTRDWVGLGARDQDEHLMNAGSFVFYPYNSAGILGIRVFLAAYSKKPDQKSEKALMALYLGEYIFDKGTCRVLKSRGGSTKLDQALDAYPSSGEWMFQGVNKEEQDGQIVRMLYDMPQVVPPTTPKLPKSLDYLTRAKSQAARVDLWDIKTVVFTGESPSRSSASAPMSNNLIADFQRRIANGSYLDIYRSYFTSGDIVTEAQALGKQDIANTQEWFHEQRTPIALDQWELFVHLPMLLITSYIHLQQFDEALAAVRLVFDPTATSQTGSSGQSSFSMESVWKFVPFRKLAKGRDTPLQPNTTNTFNDWRNNPFKPYSAARGRHTAYMKWFVYKYIEIMIEKGDYYFRQFTLESISLAIQCYVEASHVYGQPPQSIMSVGKKTAESYLDLHPKPAANSPAPSAPTDLFNVLVSMETSFPFRNEAFNQPQVGTPKINLFGTATAPYFCVPANPALLELRRLIDDRLYKIRNCQDIDGNSRSTGLFEPPLDPGAIVKTVAGGGGLGSIIDDISGPTPNFRFSHLYPRAVQICVELKDLGAQIMILREKKDGELLASLQLEQLKAASQRLIKLRTLQHEEGVKVLAIQRDNRSDAVNRLTYFLDLLGEDHGIIPAEGDNFTPLTYGMEKPRTNYGLPLSRYQRTEIDLATSGLTFSTLAGAYDAAAGFLGGLPKVRAEGAPLGVGVSTEFGGQEVASMTGATALVFRTIGEGLRWGSENAARFSQFEQETLDRKFEANNIGSEITGLDAEIKLQQVRIDQALQQIEIEQRSLEQEEETASFLRSKYTNAELYIWSINRLQKLYYSTYNLALGLACQAERAYRFERGLSASDATIIQGGYWNSGRDGLYAGEHLAQALHRLEQTHIETSTHDFELTRNVSLRQINPFALEMLRTTGKTGDFDIPEVFWDMDFPGHINRRIKSVAVSVLCVVGPYTSINATLTLGKNFYRTKGVSAEYGRYDPTAEPLPSFNVFTRSVGVCSAQSDNGVFELDFEDERYMPFEGAGLISTWNLALNSIVRPFSYATISDVVLHIQYTSDRGDKASYDAAAAAIGNFLTVASGISTARGLCLLVDVRAEFGTAWEAFRTTGTLRLQALGQRLPYFARAGSASAKRVRIAIGYNTAATSGASLSFEVGSTPGTADGPLAIPSSSSSTGETSAMFDRPLAVEVMWENSASEDLDWVFSMVEADQTKKTAAAKGVTSMHLLIAYSLYLP